MLTYADVLRDEQARLTAAIEDKVEKLTTAKAALEEQLKAEAAQQLRESANKFSALEKELLDNAGAMRVALSNAERELAGKLAELERQAGCIVAASDEGLALGQALVARLESALKEAQQQSDSLEQEVEKAEEMREALEEERRRREEAEEQGAAAAATAATAATEAEEAQEKMRDALEEERRRREEAESVKMALQRGWEAERGVLQDGVEREERKRKEAEEEQEKMRQALEEEVRKRTEAEERLTAAREGERERERERERETARAKTKIEALQKLVESLETSVKRERERALTPPPHANLTPPPPHAGAIEACAEESPRKKARLMMAGELRAGDPQQATRAAGALRGADEEEEGEAAGEAAAWEQVAVMEEEIAGTQFTCFTGTKIQILTLLTSSGLSRSNKALKADTSALLLRAEAAERGHLQLSKQHASLRAALAKANAKLDLLLGLGVSQSAGSAPSAPPEFAERARELLGLYQQALEDYQANHKFYWLY
jgi:hypothetical protein